jgi:hypothetical protein
MLNISVDALRGGATLVFLDGQFIGSYVAVLQNPDMFLPSVISPLGATFAAVTPECAIMQIVFAARQYSYRAPHPGQLVVRYSESTLRQGYALPCPTCHLAGQPGLPGADDSDRTHAFGAAEHRRRTALDILNVDRSQPLPDVPPPTNSLHAPRWADIHRDACNRAAFARSTVACYRPSLAERVGNGIARILFRVGAPVPVLQGWEWVLSVPARTVTALHRRRWLRS